MTKAELQAADVVSQDNIWKQSVDVEQNAIKKWQTSWGFLTEYNSKVQH